jgi:hypothetical protein
MQDVNHNHIMTDLAGQNKDQFRSLFLGHGRVNHAAGEYGRGRISTKAEGAFSISEGGMKGVSNADVKARRDQANLRMRPGGRKAAELSAMKAANRIIPQ